MSYPGPCDGGTSVSDDSTPDVVATPDSTESVVLPESDLQDTTRPRHWRQRYAGPEGSYVFRSRMTLRGPAGDSRRVERGEPVRNEGFSPRRLKALWYSNNIELADPSAPRAGSRKLKKVVVDNEAIRRQDEARQTAALNAARAENELRKKLRAQAREEARQRELAELAVKIAEEKELQEMRELGLEDDREAFEALVQERLEQAKAKAEEDAELEKQLAEERAELDKLRAEEKAAADARLAQEKAAADAERRAKKEARAQARTAGLMRTRQSNSGQPATGFERNPNTETTSALEAKKRARRADGLTTPED